MNMEEWQSLPRSFRFFLMIIASVASLSLAAMAAALAALALRPATPPPSFAYTGATVNGITCEGDDLSLTIYGESLGTPNYTVIGHDIYTQDGQLVKRLEDPEPVVGGDWEAYEFEFDTFVKTNDLKAGWYEYVRASVQLPGTEIAPLQVPFEIVACD